MLFYTFFELIQVITRHATLVIASTCQYWIPQIIHTLTIVKPTTLLHAGATKRCDVC